MRRGFDTHFGCYAGRGDFWDHSSEAGSFNGLDLRDGEKVQFLKSRIYCKVLGEILLGSFAVSDCV